MVLIKTFLLFFQNIFLGVLISSFMSLIIINTLPYECCLIFNYLKFLEIYYCCVYLLILILGRLFTHMVLGFWIVNLCLSIFSVDT